MWRMNNTDILPYKTGEDVMGNMESIIYKDLRMTDNRFWWPRGLRLGFTAACVLGLRVLATLEAWMPVPC
jgi:hypothetical protein